MSDVRTAAFRRIRELVREDKPERLDEVAREIDEIAATYASSQESVEEKGRRLLIEGRLTITSVGDGDRAAVVAECRGDSGDVYALGYDAAKTEWRCTCPKVGRSTRCSHLVALQLVTVRPDP